MDVSNTSFDFNAPQYIDFTTATASDLKEYNDDYFNVDHEIDVEFHEEEHANSSADTAEIVDTKDEKPVTEIKIEICETVETDKVDEVVHSEVTCAETQVDEHKADDGQFTAVEPVGDEQEIFQIVEVNPNPMRRSMSMGNIDVIQSLVKTEIQECLGKALDGLYLSGKKKVRRSEKKEPSRFEQVPYLFRPRSKSRDNVSQEEGGVPLCPQKYVSMAEAIKNFQQGTPERFHSKSKNCKSAPVAKCQRLSCTVPQSPQLLCKTRSRPVQYLSHHEQEEMQADQMKKYHIKPQPLNHKIFKTPTLLKKPDGKEAFKIKRLPAKKVVEKLPAVAEVGRGAGASTNELRLKNVELRYDGVEKQCTQRPHPTKLQPFSFEERNRQMLERKEEKLRRFLEEEKKLRVFHARPVPGCVKSASSESLARSRLPPDENCEPGSEAASFRARPATVVHQKPFVPKKADRPLVEVQEFQLSSARRAQERQQFELRLREKEQTLDSCRRQYHDQLQQREQRDVAQLRRTLVHRALPVRQYKPVEVQPSTKKLTMPRSPLPAASRTK